MNVSRRALQRAILTGLRVSGLRWLLAPIAGGRGAILTFHRVREAAPESFAPNAHLEVTPAFLAEIIRWARDSGIDIVTLDEALERVRTPGSRRFVVLTFDDGFRDNLEVALPVLREGGAPFTIYVATGFIDRTANPWWMTLEEAVRNSAAIRHPDRSGRIMPSASEVDKANVFSELAEWLQAVSEDEQRVAADWLAMEHAVDVKALVADAFMDWEELAALAAEPLATIGAHTHNHVAVAKLAPAEARAEIAKSADLLERRLGRRPRHFAYPYGYPSAVGPRDYRIVADLGFASAVLTSPGVLREGSLETPTALPRISMNGHFQKRRYLDTLASGVPFLPARLRASLGGRSGPAPATATASASSG